MTPPPAPARIPWRRIGFWGSCAAGLGLLALASWAYLKGSPGAHAAERRPARAAATAHAATAGHGAGGPIVLSAEQQKAIGLRTEPVVSGTAAESLSADGRIAPDESHYAHVTPRAAGVMRTVAAHIGQDVKAGDLLATIDSAVVAQARLELVTRSQELQVAQTKADWQEAIYRTTVELIDRLKAGDSPEEIHRRFEDRPVGENRERLVTAYADYRLDKVRMQRNKELYEKNAAALAQYEKVRAEYEASLATYQSLMDRMGFESKLAHTLAQQDLRQAQTAVRVAQERLRVLGVRPDGTEPKVEGGKVVGVTPEGTLEKEGPDTVADLRPEKILPPRDQDDPKAEPAVDPVGSAHPDDEHKPISTYALWAPFDGTILDRAMIVPGVAVQEDQSLFTMADLSSVWVEVHVHESDFGKLARSHQADVRFTSNAYPGRTFTGKVIYTGDLVEEKTRRVLLLARADNPDRALKPGMFVDVEVIAPGAEELPLVPASALITEGDKTLVYIRTGPEHFERREVLIGPRSGDRVAVLSGIEPGQQVVVQGAFKLKAVEERSESGDEAA